MYFKNYRFLLDLVWGICPSLGLKDEKEEAIDPNSKAPFLPHKEESFFDSFL